MNSNENVVIADNVPEWLNIIKQFYFDLGDKQTEELFQSMEAISNSSDKSNDEMLFKESNRLVSITRLTSSFLNNYRKILLPAVSQGITEWVNSKDSKIPYEKKIKLLKKMIEQILEQIDGTEESGLKLAQQELLSLLDEVKRLIDN